MKERWCDIPGYEGEYQVSDQGRVRSLGRYVRTVSRHGTEAERYARGQVLKLQKHSAGYAHVRLSSATLTVHTLVLAAFKGPCPKGMEIAHNNGRKKCNKLFNLRYDFHKNNLKDMILHKTIQRGIKNPSVKLTREQVKQIRTAREITQRELSGMFGVSQSHISRLVTRKQWSYLP